MFCGEDCTLIGGVVVQLPSQQRIHLLDRINVDVVTCLILILHIREIRGFGKFHIPCAPAFGVEVLASPLLTLLLQGNDLLGALAFDFCSRKGCELREEVFCLQETAVAFRRGIDLQHVAGRGLVREIRKVVRTIEFAAQRTGYVLRGCEARAALHEAACDNGVQLAAVLRGEVFRAEPLALDRIHLCGQCLREGSLRDV